MKMPMVLWAPLLLLSAVAQAAPPFPSYADYHRRAVAERAWTQLADNPDAAARTVDEALRWLEPGAELLVLRAGIGRALERPDESLHFLRQAHALSPDNPGIRAELVGALVDGGQADEAAALLPEELTGPVDLLAAALVDCVGRADTDSVACRAALMRAADGCVPGLATLALQPRWDRLADDTVFVESLTAAMARARTLCGS